MIHGEYHPARSGALEGEDPRQALARAVTAGTLTDKELRRRYCGLVLVIAGNKAEAACRLGLNRQTLTRLIDENFYMKLR